MNILRLVVLLPLLAACGDDTTSAGTGGGGGAGGGAGGATTAASTSDAASTSTAGGGTGGAAPIAAEGTCEFTVDGVTYTASGFGALVTGEPDGWQLQCSVSEDQIGHTVNMAVTGLAEPGTYTVETFGQNGTVAYTEQGVDGGTAPLEQYRTTDDWTLALTTTDATTLVGSASFVGVLAGKPDKVVSMAFNLERM